jgi:hypothetical protein
MSLKKLKLFIKKITHYGCLFVCEKIHEQIPLKLICLSPFVMLQSLWQVPTS